MRAHHAVFANGSDQDAAAVVRTADAAGGEQGVGALGAEQIRYAHARDHVTDRIGRIGHRYAQDRGTLALALRIEPKRRALAPVAQFAFSERYAPIEQRQDVFRRQLFGDAEINGIAIWRTPQEIEYVVFAWVTAGRETGPGDGRLRWIGRCQMLVVPLRAQGREMG